MPLEKKLAKLKKIISSYNSCLLAFSGGVDSTLLLRVLREVLPENKLLAVTADSATYPKEELFCAKRIAKRLGVRHKIIKTFELQNPAFIANPVNRCYFCKKELFGKLKNLSRKFNLNFVLDASNLSDAKDYRPGNLAKKELNVRSPLQEAEFSKSDIRKLSKRFELETWDKPNLACLASRIPYATKISLAALKRINRGEVILRQMGFSQVRLRHYNGLCRIEVLKNDIPRLVSKRKQVIDKLKKIGYNYVTLDLEGYRTGSLNEVVRR